MVLDSFATICIGLPLTACFGDHFQHCKGTTIPARHQIPAFDLTSFLTSKMLKFGRIDASIILLSSNRIFGAVFNSNSRVFLQLAQTTTP